MRRKRQVREGPGPKKVLPKKAQGFSDPVMSLWDAYVKQMRFRAFRYGREIGLKILDAALDFATELDEEVGMMLIDSLAHAMEMPSFDEVQK